MYLMKMKRISRNSFLLFIALVMALGTGCAVVPLRKPVPEALVDEVTPSDMPLVRVWGDIKPKHYDQWYSLPQDELKKRFPGIFGKSHAYLALSGGGADGAFGAGLLNGWTAAGNRPEFTIVTGISTGSLIAPFAFLGPEYDPILKEIYTQNKTEDLIESLYLVQLIGSQSLLNTAKLRKKIAQYMTPEVVRKIAVEHKKGRRLLIGTVNLDAARPVIWSVSKIATLDRPEAVELICDIMLASASIPGAFPPVYFKVRSENGETFDEMHVDGGTANQVFLYPAGINWGKAMKKLQVTGQPAAYVIRNTKISPVYEPVKPKLPMIAGRSISSLIRTQGFGDIFQIYYTSQRDGVDFNLAYVPDSFDIESKDFFDQNYMTQLYELGYRMAKDGYPWEKTPPGLGDAAR